MNKKTILLLSIALIMVGGLFFVLFTKSKQMESLNAETGYTPKQIWDMQYKKKKARRAKGYNKADKPNEFTNYFKLITSSVDKNETDYKMGYQSGELKKLKEQQKSKKVNQVKEALNFVSRGPGNVGGRTRAIIVDPDDATHKTWYVGAATGGIWKTTDEAKTWTNLSDKFTNLSVNALAMASSNHNIIYAGTGESFPGGTGLFGNGIWKTTDKGNNWEQLASTSTDEKFGYINRIVIDPTNADIVLVATEKGIFKSNDGGTTWKQVYESRTGVEDLVEHPTNFNTLFAGESMLGVIRSEDAGETWTISSEGLGAGGRFEVAISKVNPDYVFASKEINDKASEVFISKNAGKKWMKFKSNKNFLGGQGGYDNTIEAHPYNVNEVYVGGVDLWHLTFDGEEKETPPAISDIYNYKASFLSFINFTTMKFPSLNGGLDTNVNGDIKPTDWVSVELRFGSGIKQKAHRFTVPDKATSGVSDDKYTYQDYVEVPFQAWDITNNRQLMISFRDQEKDGKFNLYPRSNTGDEYGKLGREYIYINLVPYDDANPNQEIAKKGGHVHKALHMFWAVLTEGMKWKPDSLPNSKIVIKYGKKIEHTGKQFCIGDAYNQHDGKNHYEQSDGKGTTAIPGLHPDHHNLAIIPTGGKDFTIINTNDGGIAISKDKGETFKMLLNNYVTTQFYGVARHPKTNEYLGGMQDNGTWKSEGNSENDKSKYLFMLGGDGFECLWHSKDPNLMLGSLYNNQVYKSTSAGFMWNSLRNNGLNYNKGPFLTKLSNSKQNPDLVFAVGSEGVYRSSNFGNKWELIKISDKWASKNKVTGAHNVEVSLANSKVVWAGAGMAKSVFSMQVSTDEGKKFHSVPNYDKVEMDAYTSGIATHPTDQNTAYVLFSRKGMPKVLRTNDLGKKWEDISGFEENKKSSNGFPDVIVHCLLVMPYDTNILWVGTDIGIVESTDNGVSWKLLESNFPSVSVYDMQIVQNQVVIATHGRGIWSVDIPEIDKVPFISELLKVKEKDQIATKAELKVAYDSLQIVVNGKIKITQKATAAENKDILFDFDKSDNYIVYLLGYTGGKSYQSNTVEVNAWKTGIEENQGQIISIYPNPNKGEFNIEIDEENTKVEIFALNGAKVYGKIMQKKGIQQITLSETEKGTYLVKITNKKGVVNKRIVVQ